MNPYAVTDSFEARMAEYCGAPYAIAIDNCSNALFLSLYWEKMHGRLGDVTIPSRTYVSVPNMIIHAGGKVHFKPSDKKTLCGAYPLEGTPVIDAALSLHKNMYTPGTQMCLSFSGPKKHLKLGKGGMILTDNAEFNLWARKARYSGRNPVAHTEDTFDTLGWNFYMMPDIAARGLVLMLGMPDHNPDLDLEYADLSQFPIFSTNHS